MRARRGKLFGLSSISAVVPTLDAGRTLAGCLQDLQGVGELLLIDGGSTDDTIAIGEAAGARIVISPKGRGMQLKAGGEAARGDWLLFLHADTRLGNGWQQAVKEHLLFSRRPACFRLKLDDSAWQARLIERGVHLRVRLLGLPYGDQGLLVPRSLYLKAGGFRPLPLMEDVDLVRRLRSIRVLDADALTSADRWRRDGWMRRSARNLACLGLYTFGVRPERIARFYG